MEFADWAIQKKLKWIGVDCGAADHPMNKVCRTLRLDLAKEAEEHLVKPLDEIFSHKDSRQFMYIKLFPAGIIYAENLGGEIDKLSNQRMLVKFFPWRGVDMEASIVRCVAFVRE